MINAYITNIDTKIVKRKYVEGKTHIAPEKNLVLDYSKYNIEMEDIYINDIKVDSVYSSSLGYVLVSDYNPQNLDINIRVDFEKRLNILKSLTCRLLIESVVSKYFGLVISDFFTSYKISKFQIKGIFFDNDAREIIRILEKNINEYIKYDAKIISNKYENYTKINGILNSSYMEYTLSSINEIRNFKIENYSVDNKGLIIYYTVI